MKVFPELIISQGFCQYKSKMKNVIIFTKENENDTLFLITWNGDNDYMTIHYWKNNTNNEINFDIVKKLFLIKCSIKIDFNDFNFTEDDPSVVFEGKIKNSLELFKLFIDVKIVDSDINIPKNIDEKYFNDGYVYDEMTFDLTSKMLISMFNEEEEYEKSKMIWNHYVSKRQKNQWTNSFSEII